MAGWQCPSVEPQQCSWWWYERGQARIAASEEAAALRRNLSATTLGPVWLAQAGTFFQQPRT